jgi:hypothetical protein
MALLPLSECIGSHRGGLRELHFLGIVDIFSAISSDGRWSWDPSLVKPTTVNICFWLLLKVHLIVLHPSPWFTEIIMRYRPLSQGLLVRRMVYKFLLVLFVQILRIVWLDPCGWVVMALALLKVSLEPFGSRGPPFNRWPFLLLLLLGYVHRVVSRAVFLGVWASSGLLLDWSRNWVVEVYCVGTGRVLRLVEVSGLNIQGFF